MFYSVGSTQSLAHAERHLSGFVPTLMEYLTMSKFKEIYLKF